MQISTNVWPVTETAVTSVLTLLAPICVDVSLVLSWIQMGIPAQVSSQWGRRTFKTGSTHPHCHKNIRKHIYASFTDHDECATSLHGCQHKCNNLNGSFFCSCNAGFVLNKDNKTCSGRYIFFLLSRIYKQCSYWWQFFAKHLMKQRCCWSCVFFFTLFIHVAYSDCLLSTELYRWYGHILY